MRVCSLGVAGGILFAFLAARDVANQFWQQCFLCALVTARAHNPTPTDASVPIQPHRPSNPQSFVHKLGDSISDLFNPAKWTEERPDPTVRARCGAGIVACEQAALWRASTLRTLVKCRVDKEGLEQRATSGMQQAPMRARVRECMCACARCIDDGLLEFDPP